MIDFKVARKGPQRGDALTATYVLTVDSLPGREWVYEYAEMVRELMVLADLSCHEARNVLFDAYVEVPQK